MTAIPSGTKFVGIGASVPTPENKSSQNNAFQEVYTIDDLKDSVLDTTTPPTEGDVLTYTSEGVSWVAPTGGSTTTTTVVNISSAQILDMGSTPIELLPAPGANKYYDVDKVILEYTSNSNVYITISDVHIFTNGFEMISSIKDILSRSSNSYIVFSPSLPFSTDVSGWLTSQPLSINSSILLGNIDETNPTLGDGTLRAIITYTVRTFGA